MEPLLLQKDPVQLGHLNMYHGVADIFREPVHKYSKRQCRPTGCIQICANLQLHVEWPVPDGIRYFHVPLFPLQKFREVSKKKFRKPTFLFFVSFAKTPLRQERI